MNPVQSVFTYMILTMFVVIFVFWLFGWWDVDTVSTASYEEFGYAHSKEKKKRTCLSALDEFLRS